MLNSKIKKLDFGCGNGCSLDGTGHHPKYRGSWLEKYGDKNTIAIDINERDIEIARNKINNGTVFMVMDGRNMSFEDNYFDFVHEKGILHHIPDYEIAVEEIARVTKTNGKLLAFEVVNNDPVYSLFRKIGGKWRGCDIESFFSSDKLFKELEKYYIIDRVDYYWRPFILDIPSYFRDQYSGWLAGIYFQYYSSKLLKLIGLDKRFCCQLELEATKK